MAVMAVLYGCDGGCTMAVMVAVMVAVTMAVTAAVLWLAVCSVFVAVTVPSVCGCLLCERDCLFCGRGICLWLRLSFRLCCSCLAYHLGVSL